jgi:hypothetical protein
MQRGRRRGKASQPAEKLVALKWHPFKARGKKRPLQPSERPGSPHSKQNAPSPTNRPHDSTLDPLEGTPLVPFWARFRSFRKPAVLKSHLADKPAPPTRRRPGSPHSKKLYPLPTGRPYKSTLDPPESTPLVSFWARRLHSFRKNSHFEGAQLSAVP